MSSPGRAVLIPGGIVLGFMFVAVVIVLILGQNDTEALDPDTPEGTIQRFYIALGENDLDAAYALLSSNAQKESSRDQFREFTRFSPSSDQRIRIERVVIDGDRATIYLNVESFSGSGIDVSRYTYEREIHLVREDGEWKIDQPVYSLAWHRDGDAG